MNCNDSNDQIHANNIKMNCHTNDMKANHIHADSVLCMLLEELGYIETVKAYKQVQKIYA